MKKHKSRALALLLAFAMILQFCIFSSQSAWAGQVNVNAATEEQMQDGQEGSEETPALDDSQEAAPVDEAADQIETDSEEPVDSDAEESTEPEEQPATEEQLAEEPAEAPVFEGKANGIQVTVKASQDAFPEGTEISVTEVKTAQVEDAVKAAAGDVKDLRAVDISFRTEEESDVQPAEAVKVSMETAAFDKDAELIVLHIDKETGKAEKVKNAEIKDGKAVFEASGFSVYVMADVSKSEDTAAANPEKPLVVQLKAADGPVRAAAGEPETVTVAVEGAGETTSKEITLGDFEGNESLAIEGYDFVEGWYGNIKITGIQKDENGDIYFGTIEGNAITAVTLDLSQVRLVYENHVEKYNVTYKVTVDGTEVSDYAAILDLVGPAHIKTGGAIEILPTPSKGYSVSGVTATNGTVVRESGTAKYQLSDVTEDTVVTVALAEVTSYRFTFTESSNTTLRINNTNYDSGSTHNTTYTPAESISFTLTGRNQWSNNAKILNQLSITLDGENIAASIPDTAGQSATTTIPGGYQVTVTKNNANALPTYAVVLSATNGDKVRGDITVNTNFKDYNSSEVWAKQLDGVEPLAYYNGSRYITSDTGGTNDRRLTPDAFCFYNRTQNRESRYYIKAEDGYDPDDLYLYVYNYKTTVSGGSYIVGLDSAIYSRTKVSSLSRIGNVPTALRNAGYTANDYYFTIQADSNWYGRDYDDVRIFIKYEPDEAQTDTYTVWYDAANGTAAYQEDGNKEYDLNDGRTTVIEEDIPTREGYVFEGWYLEGDEDTLYQAGDLFTLDESIKDKASADHRFMFHAKWTSEASATYAPYRINVYFEDDDGVYHDGTGGTEDTPDFSSSERGNIGSIPYIISSKFNTWIDDRKPGWDEDFEYDRQTPSEAIKADGSTVIKIYYREKRISLNFVAEDNVQKINLVSGNPVSVTGDGTGNMTVVVRQKHGDAVKVQAIAADGYIVNGWTINEETAKLSDYPSLQTAITDDSAATDKWTTRTYHAWAETEKTITVTKEVHVIGTVHMDDVDTTVYFALDKDTSGATDYLKREDGSVWTEGITITNGVPESTSVSFVGVPAGEYEIWEVADANAGGLRPGQTVIPSDSQGKAIILSNIQTRHDASSSGSNDVSVSEEQTTDALTVINTFAHAGESISWTARKTWTDKDDNTLTTVPEGAYATFGIFANDDADPVATITLDGKVEPDDLEEKNPWEATFDALSRVDEDGNEIDYVVKEIDYAGKTSPLDGVYYTPVNDTATASGMSINNKQQYGNLTVKKTVDVTGFTTEEVKAAMAGLTVTVTGPHDYSEEVKFTGEPSVSGTKYTFTEELTDLPVGDYNVSEAGYQTLFEGRTWNPDYSNTTVTRDGRTIATAPAGATAQAEVADGKTTTAAIANDYHYVDITATKVWEDGNVTDAEHSAVTLGLYKIDGGEESLISEQTIPAGATEDDLTVTWANQDQQYDYTVKEARLKDYNEPVITGNKNDGFTVTNTRMETGTLKIVKTVDGPDAAKNRSYQINYDSNETAQGGVKSVNLLPASGTAETEMTVTVGEYAVTEQSGNLDLDNYTRTTTMKVGEDGEETVFPQDATGAPHLSDVTVTAGETTTVYIANNYEENTVQIDYAVAEDCDGMGTVSLESEKVKLVTSTAAGSTATANENYTFAYWTKDDGTEPISTEAFFVPEKNEEGLYEAATYYAHFNVNYTIHHYLKGTTTKVKDDETGNVALNGTVDTLHYATTYQGKALSHDVEGNPEVPVTISTAGQEITIYYTLPLTITAKDKSKVYGAEDPALEADVTGALEGDTITYELERETGENVGNYEILLSSADVPDYYELTYEKGDFEITKAQLTVTANGGSKVYGEDDPEEFTAAVTGMQNDDTEAELKELLNLEVSREAGENVGTYAVTAEGPSELENYTVTYVPGTFSITKAALTVTADNGTKKYGEADPEEFTATVTGMQNGDTEDALKELLNLDVSRKAGENVGTYAVTAAGPAELDNYTVTYVPGTFTITKEGLIVTANNKTKVYGEDDPTLTATVTGMKGGDTEEDVKALLDLELSRAEGEDVGNYKITVTGATALDNYDVTYVNGNLEITKASLVVTADNDTKVYGEKDPTLTATVTGMKNGDTEDEVKALLDLTVSREAGENVGHYVVTATGAETLANYNVEYETGDFEITKAKLTVTADNDSKVYGDADPAEFTATVTGMQNGDTEAAVKELLGLTVSRKAGEDVGHYTVTATGAETLANYEVEYKTGDFEITKAQLLVKADNAGKVYGDADPKEFTATVTGMKGEDTEAAVRELLDLSLSREEGEDVGQYTITVTGAETLDNYTVIYAPGQFAIRKAKLTVTANDDSKVYGETDPELTATVTGMKNGDTEAAVKALLNLNVSREAGEDVGHYVVTATGAETLANYEVEYKTGDFEITKAKLTVTANDDSKVYGETDPELTATVTGMQNGDTEDAVKKLLNLNVSREAGENVGHYVVTATGAETLANYEVEYKTGDFEITKAKLTVTADNDSKVYGDADPEEFTATVTGMQNGDTEEDVKALLDLAVSREAGEDVGHYVITPSGKTALSNYDVEYKVGDFEITKAKLTVTADDGSKVYGEDDPEAFTASVTGMKNGDTEAAVKEMLGLTISREEGENVGHYTITATGEETLDNYDVEYKTGDFEITKAKLTVTANDDSKVYGEEDPAEFTATVTGMKNGDTEAAVKELLNLRVSREGGENVGHYVVTATGAETIANYDVEYKTGDFEITKAKLTVTANDRSKVYGEEDPMLTATVTGMKNGDTEAAVKVMLGLNVSRAEGESVGHYTITAAGAETIANYDVEYKTGDFEITKAKLTVTADNGNKVYGEADPAEFTATVTGMKNGDTEATVKELLDLSVSREAGENVGHYVVTATGAETLDNYDVEYKTGDFEITKARLTVTANGGTKVYGEDDPEEFTATVTGMQNGDTEAELKELLNLDVSREAGENVGTYAVTATGPAKLDNYTVTYVPGTFSITKAALTVTADNGTKKYGEADPKEFTATVTGMKNGDTEAALKELLNLDVSREAGENVGAYKITATGETSLDNYNVTYVPGTFTITKEGLIVTANNKTKVYGENDPMLTATVTGMKGGDTEEDVKALLGLELSRAEGEDVGNYKITVTGATALDNYDVTYVNGNLEITKASLVVTADNDTKVYGEADPAAFTAKVTGMKNGDTEDDVKALLELKVEREAGENVGHYVITPSGKATLANYNVEYKTGVFEITKAKLTVTADNGSKVYGDADPAEFTATVTGMQNGDTEAAVKELLGLTVSRKAGENVGHYTVTATGAETLANYEVEYKTGDFEITKAQLLVKADNAGKVYGDADPEEFTATVTGMKGEDTEAAVRDLLGLSLSREAGEDVGQYTITVTGAETLDNYTVIYVPGQFAIRKAKLTVTANDDSKVYGETDPELTATVTGMKNGDTEAAVKALLNLNVSREAGEDVGHYVVTATGAETLANYEVEYKTGDFEITKAKLTVTANDDSKVYGETDPELTATVTGMQNGDTEDAVKKLLNLNVSREAGENVGHYIVTATGAETLDNYDVEYKTGDFEITKATLTVTADPISKDFGTDDPALSVTVTGMQNGDTEEEVKALLDLAVSREDGEDAGHYVITPSGKEAIDNYNVKYVTGDFEIKAVPLSDARIEGSDPEDTVYNGLEQQQPVTITDSKTGETLVEGVDYEIEYTDATNAGTVTVTIRGIGNYSGEITRTYEITRAPLTIVTSSANRQYDGTPLTAGGRIEGLVNNETATIRTTGSQTAVGSSSNTYQLAWDGTALESNYEITRESLGTLTVTAVPAPTPDDPTPTPDTPTPTPTPAPGGGTAPAVTPTPAPAPNVTPIDPEPTPQVDPEPTPIDPDPAPKGNGEGAWALLNLIAAILTALLSLIMLIRCIGKKHKEEEDEQTGQTTETKIKKKGLARLLSLIPAIAAIVTFILTEDMSDPWVWTDKWTLLMAVYLVVNVIMAVIAHKTKDEDENDPQQSQQA